MTASTSSGQQIVEFDGVAPQQRGPDIVVRPVTVAIVGGGEQRVGGARVLTAAPFPGKGQTFEALDRRVTAKKERPRRSRPCT
jgi:hypothetical protein